MSTPTTPITYFPVPLQKQLLRNHAEVRGKAYADLFLPDLGVPPEAAAMLAQGPLPENLTLTPSLADINRLLDPAMSFPDRGWALLDGPTAYAQSRFEMPGVTCEMIKWWMLWHPLEKQRYMLWFPHAHIDNYVEDPRRLADPTLSYEQRLYGNPNHIHEYIGPSALPLIIHFTDPTELGLDAAALRRSRMASFSGTLRLADAPETSFMLMLHLARDTERGLELVSRYWIGPHPEMRRFPGAADAPSLLPKLGMSRDTMEVLAYEMAVHDMTEFAQLARILPDVYRRFGSAPV